MAQQVPEVDFIWLLLTGTIVMFLLVLTIIIFVVMYQKRFFAQKLHIKQIENEHGRELLSASIQIQEQERQRIASDLHDDVGAILSTTKLYLSHLVEGEQESNDIAKKVENLVDNAIHNLRGISRNISPHNLEKFGLNSAIEDICLQINAAHKLKISFESNLDKRLVLEIELNIYRIVQELLNNTIKHSGASEASISIDFSEENEHLTLKYKDNGKGIEKHLFEKNNIKNMGLGLKNITSRVELLKANIHYIFEQNHGFNVIISLKL
jgi:signal transduction histidine kinase